MLGAAYMLRLGQKLAWGEPTQAKAWKDLNLREWSYLVPLAILVFYIGLAPGLTLRVIDPSLNRVLDRITPKPKPAIVKTAVLPNTQKGIFAGLFSSSR
jgi:NADH:ubiquinone oxidoreductase subunit 4 (subunit M)